MPERTKRKKKFDWFTLKKKCPKCNSIEIENINKFKRVWKQRANGKWELKEIQMKKCKKCNHTWWDKGGNIWTN